MLGFSCFKHKGFETPLRSGINISRIATFNFLEILSTCIFQQIQLLEHIEVGSAVAVPLLSTSIFYQVCLCHLPEPLGAGSRRC